MEERKIVVDTKLSTKAKVIIASIIGAIVTISIFVIKRISKNDE